MLHIVNLDKKKILKNDHHRQNCNYASANRVRFEPYIADVPIRDWHTHLPDLNHASCGASLLVDPTPGGLEHWLHKDILDLLTSIEGNIYEQPPYTLVCVEPRFISAPAEVFLPRP